MLSILTTGRAAKLVRIAAVALATLAFMPSMEAVARSGGGFSQGSRGFKTYTPPPSTRTAPGTAQPMQRSATPADATRAGQSATAQSGRAAASQSRFGSGFMAGLLGAGLLGVLLGAGLFGNLGSLTAILGFLLQLALIAGAVYLVMGFFRSRSQAPASGPRDGYGMGGMARNGLGQGSASPGGGVTIGSRAPATSTTPLSLVDADFSSFERLLAVVQTAYGREDRDALRSAATEEMVGYFEEDLEANARKGVRNELGEPKLLQGDLSEAWSEPSGEYASVAMRYALTDAMVDRATGRIVSGSRTTPDEVTEVWTFTRRHGGGPGAWRLSAIQQVE